MINKCTSQSICSLHFLYQTHCRRSHLESNDILAVDLTDVVIGEQTIAGSRTVLHQRCDASRFEDEAHVARAVFVHGDCTLEWSKTEKQSVYTMHFLKPGQLE